ncbi:MAG: hypothetical protein R3E89_06235 [Thiolinea sp.]
MLTGLSTDFLGERLLSVLQTESVNCQLIVRKHAPTTLGFVQHDASGVPSYAFMAMGPLTAYSRRRMWMSIWMRQAVSIWVPIPLWPSRQRIPIWL